jgi:hypothetical protein
MFRGVTTFERSTEMATLPAHARAVPQQTPEEAKATKTLVEGLREKTQQQQEILPDKDAGGPVSQLKKNLSVYAQVYAECMKHAGKIVDDNLDGPEPLDAMDFMDQQEEIATVIFQQFWNDQIAIKANKNQGATADVLKSFLEEQGRGGGGMGMGYPLIGGMGR